MAAALERVHATAIAAGSRAALIFGASGSGKSDLALRCLTLPQSALTPHVAHLVADDQVMLERNGLQLIASAPPALLGLIEVRGLGILTLKPAPATPVVLAVELQGPGLTERFPDPWPFKDFLGLKVPVLRLWAFESAAAQKVLVALSCGTLPQVAL